MFEDTIYNNIVLGHDKVEEEDLLNIIKMANLENFIEGLDEGVETSIYGNGLNLSGGQKQRISLARALVADTSVLILDEVTSSQDKLSTSVIMENIKSISKDKIVIMITHKLSDIELGDIIYKVEKGRVIKSLINECKSLE